MTTVATNYRGGGAEIDLIMLDGNTLVFAEVRLRSNRHFATAAASVDQRKQSAIQRAALAFLRAHESLSQLPCRFDVLAYTQTPGPGSAPLWIKSAFDASTQAF